LTGNLLIAQSGGPTAVINSSVCGIIDEAKQRHQIRGIFGAVNGIIGVLDEEIVDLRQEDPATISNLRMTPSAALGSCRYKLNGNDYSRVMDVLRAHEVSYFIYAGGNDSMDTAHKIASVAADRNYDLNIMGVPKTVDNDLLATDHCPGYGSVARFNSIAVRDAGLDTDAIYTTDAVKIIETMGRDAGWITASTALGKDAEDSAPHLIYLPERPFVTADFLADVESVYKRLKRVVVCVCEGLRDGNGEFVRASGRQVDVDKFGHAQLGGVGDYLVGLISENLRIKARCDRPGTIQRVSMANVSQVDLAEAYQVGQVATARAVEGESGKMVTLIKKENDAYECETGLVELEKVALKTKKVPDEFINKDSNFVSEAFLEYARPLIGAPLPEYVHLKRSMVKKILEARPN
jgi:ATP-dependent phosphofructokinase / diphosphate-dependent phosphofructokinase